MSNYSFESAIFDLDGVITKTARVHAKAWKDTFDEYMKLRQKRDNEPFTSFDKEKDYLVYVDGKPRYKGVNSFLESRNIKIPFGQPSDGPEKETVCGIGNKKNVVFRNILNKQGAEIYASSIKFIKKLKSLGIKLGVASSSKNCRFILKYASLEKLFATRVDGEVSAQLGLKGKPEGDIFVRAAENIEAKPIKSIVIEDATSGVKAGRNGGFGLVIGIARTKNKIPLLKNGADVVVNDLAEINIKWINNWFKKYPKLLLKSWDSIKDKKKLLLDDKKIDLNIYHKSSFKDLIRFTENPVIILNYDEINPSFINRGDTKKISKSLKSILKNLSLKYKIIITSNRKMEDLQHLFGLNELYYASNHNLHIHGPDLNIVHPKAKKIRPTITKIYKKLTKEMSDIKNLIIENNKFSISVNYRFISESNIEEIHKLLQTVLSQYSKVKMTDNNKIIEIFPEFNWGKVQSLPWMLKIIKKPLNKFPLIYVGNYEESESVFPFIRTRGIGVLMSNKPKSSTADFRIKNITELKKLLNRMVYEKEK